MMADWYAFFGQASLVLVSVIFVLALVLVVLWQVKLLVRWGKDLDRERQAAKQRVFPPTFRRHGYKARHLRQLRSTAGQVQRDRAEYRGIQGWPDGHCHKSLQPSTRCPLAVVAGLPVPPRTAREKGRWCHVVRARAVVYANRLFLWLVERSNTHRPSDAPTAVPMELDDLPML
jgi:hypothetical protein